MKLVAIGELTSQVCTWSPVSAPDSEFTYVDLSAVDSLQKAITTQVVMRGREAPSRARQLIQTGDVLVSTVRPNLNAVAAVKPDLDGATASTGFCVLRPSDRLDSRYLFHWVRTPNFVADMVRRATGASYPAVSDRIVKESVIPHPPIEEQSRIAAILDQADELRSARNQTVVHLEALAGSLFTEMFGAHKYKTAELSEVVRTGTIVTYGIVQAGPEYDGGVPYVRTGDIVDGVIRTHGLRHTDPAIASKFERSRVSAGDIVMSIRATVGTTAFVPPELDGANLTQGTAKISPSDIASGPYLLHYLRSPSAQRWIQAKVKGATFREITLGALRQLPVPLASVSLQQEFADRLQALTAAHCLASASSDHLDELFASLQSRAFSGQL